MKKFYIMTATLCSVLFVSLTALAQTEDDVVINEFVVNAASGKEYVELLVVTDGVNMQGWTISDVGTRTGTGGATEGDITLPSSASYLSNVARGTYIVIELTTPAANSSTLPEDLDPTGDRRIIIKTTTSGVTFSNTLDNATNDNLHLYAGSRATGTLIDQVLCGTNSSYITGATWGDNNSATTTDNVNGGATLPSNSAVRFVPSDQSQPSGFQANDTGTDFVVDASSYGTPGAVNTGVDDGGGSLPITLASFTGTVVSGNNVHLEWMTISEVNNYGFFVQRRAEGAVNFVELPNSFVPGLPGTPTEPRYYSWTDENVPPGTYDYRLRQVDLDGSMSFSWPVSVVIASPTSVGDGEIVPAVFKLNQNYPNPFNPSTKISFSLAEPGFTTLKLYNVLGQEVATLFNGMADAGRMYVVDFDASHLGNGVYFYRLASGGKVEVRKMTLMK